MKQLKLLRYSAPNLFIMLRVSPDAISFLHFVQYMLVLLDRSVIQMLQTCILWCNTILMQYLKIYVKSNSHVLSPQSSQQSFYEVMNEN